jgi:hypothetical protein
MRYWNATARAGQRLRCCRRCMRRPGFWVGSLSWQGVSITMTESSANVRTSVCSARAVTATAIDGVGTTGLFVLVLTVTVGRGTCVAPTRAFPDGPDNHQLLLLLTAQILKVLEGGWAARVLEMATSFVE